MSAPSRRQTITLRDGARLTLRQLLSFADCQPYLSGYCREVGLPEDGADFVAELKAA